MSDTYTMRGRATSRMTLWKKMDMQLRFGYRAPRQTPQGRSKSMSSIDLAMNTDILKKKGTITLSIRDIFNTRKYRGETFLDDFYSDSEFQWRTRTATLTFNYRLNQKKKRGGRGRGGYGGSGGRRRILIKYLFCKNPIK